jgi:RNA polymerase sigma factor (sigma-70 family)
MAVTLSPTLMVPAHDEAGLVAATRAGDDRAFEELYARYQERIFGFILNRVRDHGRAEDIAQEVFVSALRRLRAGDQEIAFKPWIYEIAKNACIDEFRRGNRSREVPLEADPELPIGRPTTLSFLPTPSAAVESKQRIDDLRGAFGGLSDSHHQLLVLREFEGLSYDEIGQRLDMTRQMVESSLFRARRKLSEEYEELASGRRCQQVQLAIDAGALASARALGIRDRRRFARHLSHCQSCRHVAVQAGVDEALVRPRSIASKIAALLPFPMARLRWPGGRGGSGAASGGAGGAGGSHSLAAPSLQSAPVLAEQASSPAVALGPVAVAAAALTIAGVGGGLLHNALTSGHAGRPAGAPAAATATHVRSHHGSAGGVSPASFRGHRSGVMHAAPGSSATAHRVVTIGPGPTGSGSSHAPGSAHASGKAATTAGAPTASSPTGPASALSGAASSATAPVKHVVSTAGSGTQQVLSTTTQQLGSAAQQVVTGAGKTVSTVANGATSIATKTVQGVAQTVQGVAKSVQGVASGGGSSPASASSAASATPAPPLSTVTQPVTQTVDQTKQAVGQTVQGLLP